ncbi:RNA binding protein [Oryctes borbonicus]|uniref:U11/U12 small nuclear ribonucleoprotein 35 kDa protein n=1 Tax=Oryctes borbonicus TaxID=1629725 RepID=A0A0T6BBY8_9SCAR|nr:RNA binding protein [Oryctes borbonicus]
MSETNSSGSAETWSKYAKYYNPLKIGSIDGTDIEPHDRAIVRAINSEYAPNKHVKGRPECTIFVSRLNLKTTKETIKDIFSKFGKLKRFRLVKDIVTGFPKGYAFIEYESESSAEEAYRTAYKMNIDGNAIFVDFECERLLKGWKPRRLGGGFGGNKESGQLRFGGRDRPFKKPISLHFIERDRCERWNDITKRRNYDKYKRTYSHTFDFEDEVHKRQDSHRRYHSKSREER